MIEDFLKFPSTPHLTTLLGVSIRSDKVLTEFECEEFLRHEVIVEEKVDGANLGISFDKDGNIRCQNRGSYLRLPGTGQWKKLDNWLMAHADMLFKFLSDRYVLFGEWCYAQHSIFYNRLPDWFLAFDIYDRDYQRFMSSACRDLLVEKMLISKVPSLACGRFSCIELKQLISQSKLTDQIVEGLYLRIDRGDWLEQRAKLVRPSFIQTIEKHWSRSAIKPNRLCTESYG